MSTNTPQGKDGEMTSPQELEENKRIVREFIETAFNQHEADKAGALLTPDMKWHGGTLGTVEGRENVAGLVRTIVEATHEGDLLGIPASGRHVQWDAVDVYRVADGRIAEEWAADDLLAFVYGVGAYTPPWLAQQPSRSS